MKKKSIFLSILLVLTMIFSACDFSNPSRTTKTEEETAEIMEQAIEKMDSVSEMMFRAIEANTTTQSLSLVERKDPPTRYMSASSETPPINVSNWNCDEAVVRQIFVNYPYHILNYIAKNTGKKNYNQQFKVGTTIYGTATRTISEQINEIFKTPGIQNPTLAINVQKEDNGISFTADWDWRNSILEQYAPKYNSVIMVNGKIEYSRNKKQVEKIMLTWYWTELNGEFIASVMDFTENEFYYMEGWKGKEWNELKSLEKSIPDLFNDGELTFEQVFQFPYGAIRAVKSNITSNIDELIFKSFTGDSNQFSSGSSDRISEAKTLWTEVYSKVSTLKMRGEKDYMSLENATEVDFMNDAANYGLERSGYVVSKNGIEFLFIEEKDMSKFLQDVEKAQTVKNNIVFSEFIKGAQGGLQKVKDRYMGQFAEYKGVNYALEYVFGENYNVDNWRHHSDTFEYKLTDGNNALTFERIKGQFVNVKINGVSISLAAD